MKKILLCIILVIMIVSIGASAADLCFEPVGGGYFIYCNNPEAITDDLLMNGPRPAYVMNNENLGPGTYYVYMSHFNYTGSWLLGDDIELDLEMTPLTDDCVYTIQNAAFETGVNTAWLDNGNLVKYESDWGLLNCCAKMLGKPICHIDGGAFYQPYEQGEFASQQISGSGTKWLSSYTPGYSKVTSHRMVHMQAVIVIEKGSMNLNVCAFKSSDQLGDRSSFNPDAYYGVYYRDRCTKGVADTLPQVKAELEYVIDDEIKDGDSLPVTVYNQYVPDGNTVTQWLTNLSPQSDKWSKHTLAESDILQFNYKDESKLDYYGAAVPEDVRDTIWTFDSFHSDTKGYEKGFNVDNPDEYIPNFELDITKNNDDYACCLGNYGVTVTYDLTVTNNSDRTRYFEYLMATQSNILVYKTDAEGNFDYVYAKGYTSSGYDEFIMEVQELPANSTTRFTMNMILPVNYNGGMKNRFRIADTYNNHESYEELKEKEPIRTTYKPIYGQYLATVKDKLPQEVLKQFETNLDNYEIVQNGDTYLVRWCAWDGKPNYYYNGWDLVSSVFLLDEGFNIIGGHSFDSLPIAMSVYEGSYYVQTTDRKMYSSVDGIEWSDYYGVSIPSELPLEVDDDNSVVQWAKEDIDAAVSYGIVPLPLKNTDLMENGITRGEFSTLAAELLKEKGYKDTGTADATFLDTTDRSVLWLSSMGIIKGYDDGTFRPANSITREEAAVILSRMARLCNVEIPETEWIYTDDSLISDWARDDVYKMHSAGIMQGMEDNRFAHNESYTITQSIVTMLRLYKQIG